MAVSSARSKVGRRRKTWRPASLFVAGDVIFSSLATAAIIVVLVAVISSLTVLPALLAILGPRIDRPRIPLLGQRLDSDGGGRVWRALLRPATTRPRATLVMVSVFASFAFLHLIEVKQIGIGLAAAVVVDAFIVRIMILPSLLTLLSDAAWWPGRAHRRAICLTPGDLSLPQETRLACENT